MSADQTRRTITAKQEKGDDMEVRVFIIMEGGVIQDVQADDPEVVDVVVVDADADAELVRWPSGAIMNVGAELQKRAIRAFGGGVA